MKRKTICTGAALVIGIFLLALTGNADVKMPRIFGDHMVLQRDMNVPIWGWADPGEEVTVTFAGQTLKTKADKDGNWRVDLSKLSASAKPEVLSVKGKNEVSFSDVLVGDVWICSGQSNMEWPVNNCLNRDAEIKAADLPQIRHIKMGHNIMPVAVDDVIGDWRVASPETVANWTAVGYFFGRELHKHLNVPIGLINTSWGGTRVEAWISREKLATLPNTEGDLKNLDALGGRIDKLKAKHKRDMAAFVKAYHELEALESNLEHQKKYADPKLDDSAWKQINTPANWEATGHPGLDGEVWYRRTVKIPADWAGKDLALELGPIDEIDTTYYNGVKVGGKGSIKPLNTQYWDVPRKYVVPGKLVKAGDATIAMRIVDQCGQGGPWGGSPQDMFLAPVAEKSNIKARIPLYGKWRYHIAFALPNRAKNPVNPNTASVLYNGMVNGLIPYAIKGAIWYQGESNAGNAYAYRVRFPAMINDWRKRWNQGDFPFFWVQLANFRPAPKQPVNQSWSVVRESQDKTLSLPNTGTALAIDIGEAKNIHPKNKQDVGKRLALAARKVAYGEEIVHSGPTYKSAKTEGNKIRITFDNVGSGLLAKGGKLNQFAIAGDDQAFVWADATIDGNTVVVQSAQIKAPVAVRYAWANNPEGCNLYNKEGLPASPFRTDNWLVPTQPVD